MVHITVTSDPLKMPSLELLEMAHEAAAWPRVCPVNVILVYRHLAIPGR